MCPSSLHKVQAEFSAALLDLEPAKGFITSLKQAVTGDSELGFAIYRNNVFYSLSSALGDLYPVVKRLLGDECFRAAAVAYIRVQPPTSAAVIFYGESFADFLQNYPGCQDLGYLADVARLEWCYHQAFHALDSELFDTGNLRSAPEEQFGDLRFELQPSVQLLTSPWPIDEIWEENLKVDPGTVNLDSHPCYLVVYRHELQVQVIALSTECYGLLAALGRGASLATAWSETSASIPEEDLPGMLGYLLSLPLFRSICLPSTAGKA